MINKISGRSECFDIFAAKMAPKAISKRAGIIPLSAAKYGDEAIGALTDLLKASGKFEPTIPEAAIKGTSSARVADGVKILSDMITPQSVEDLGNVLGSASKSPGASSLIAKDFELGQLYGGGTLSYNDLIRSWSDDMIKVGEDLKNAGDGMTSAQAEAIYSSGRNSKAIKAFERLSELSKDGGAIKKAISADAKAVKMAPSAVSNAPKSAVDIAAEKEVAEEAAEAAVSTTLKPKSPANTPTPTEVAANAAARATSMASSFGVGKSIAGASLLIGGIYFGVQGIRSVFSSPEGKDDLTRVKNAIECIKDIDLVSGSPAALERDVIISNIKAYTSPTSLDAVNAARASLAGSESSPGSIAHFVYLITDDPQANLSGYLGAPVTGTGAAAIAGAGVGGAIGYGIGGPIPGLVGAALGGLIAGFAGYNFVTTRYRDQINCIVGAVDAMAAIDKRIIDAGAMKLTDGTTEGFNGAQGLGASRPEVSALAKILIAMSENKLIGKRGLNFVNEKKLIMSLLERATSPEIAATALIQSNYNIATAIKFDSIQNIIGAIDNGAVRANQELKTLMQDIIDTVPGAIRALEQGKIKTSRILHTRLSNMKKLSTSTNLDTIKKKAEESKASYFGDASSGLQDSLTKSYYAGLTGMYNEKLPSRSSDYKDLYGFQEETGGDLVQQSHSKSVTLADAMGKGGLVENGLEQQEKSHYIATSTPSGNFQSKYAQTLNYLAKLAKAADDKGKKDVSKLINQTIKTLN